jgi:hypothetical protein
LQFTPFSQSTLSSHFALSPAVWTPQEIAITASPLALPNPNPIPDDNNMSDTSDTFFTGKPEDHDPQDFMNRIERTILIKSGLTEADKVRFFELSIKTKSPADAWLSTLTPLNKTSFKTLRTAFELRWPAKPITEKTTAEKQALLDEAILKPADLGRRVAANLGQKKSCRT